MTVTAIPLGAYDTAFGMLYYLEVHDIEEALKGGSM